MSKLIKYIGLVIFFSLLYSGCTIYTPSDHSVDNTDYAVSEDFSFTVDPVTQDYLIIEAVNGTVEIMATNTSRVRINGVRTVESESYRDADTHLDFLQVDIGTNDERILVKTNQPSSSDGRNYKVEYYIEMPREWDLSIYQVNGPVLVDGLEGDMWCDLVNGNLTIDESYGNLSAGVTNGTIYADAYIAYEGYCSLHIVNGNLDLSIPYNSQAELNASVTNGIINIINLPLYYLSESRHSVRGILGDGNADITLSTVNGMITLRGK